jgi:outer membrane murein-binding lipoprotein Lpp
MEEERQRCILENLLDERLHVERKVILELLVGVLVNERQSVGGDEVEEMRQLRLEVEQLNAMIDALRRDMRQARQASSLPAVLPAAKHELN